MRRSFPPILLAFSFASACGSDDPADVNPDAGETPTADAGEQSPEDTATVIAAGASGDVGIVSTVGIPSLEVTQDAVQGVADRDIVVRRIDDEIFLLNRDQDNVTILDSDLQLVGQFSLEGHANPQDVAVLGDTLYVTAYDSKDVVVFDRSDPAADPEVIDLSSIDEEDGIPDCSGMHLAGDTLLVACQRMDRSEIPYRARGAGVIAVIDTSTNTLDTTFELARENPIGPFVSTGEDSPLGGDLLIASAADYSPENSCVERITLNPEPASEGCQLEGEDIGGTMSRMELDGDVLWYVASRADFTAFVASYDLESDSFGNAITDEGHSPNDLTICPEGEVVVADYPFGDESAGGLRIFVDGGEITEDELDTGAADIFPHGLLCY